MKDAYTHTLVRGTMSRRAESQIHSIAVQLNITEAKAIEWALMRCGLQIKRLSKKSPE